MIRDERAALGTQVGVFSFKPLMCRAKFRELVGQLTELGASGRQLGVERFNQLVTRQREPDGVKWTSDGKALITANGGEEVTIDD